MIGALLAVNFIASVIFLLKNREGKAGSALMFVLFLAVPIFGILMYYIPIWMFRALHGRNVYNIEDLIYAGENESYVERPDVEKEMNVVPVKEALVVNDSIEKRKFILDIIKTDMGRNYKTILPALQDNDSETSHYAAAMAMEIQRRQHKAISGLEEKLAQGEPVEEELLEAYRTYADNKVLTGKDMADIKERYIHLIKSAGAEKTFGKEYYITLVDYLAEKGRFEEGIAILRAGIEEKPDERFYDKLLELYYLMGRKDKFTDTIKEIRNSDTILSPERLERLRFWIRRGEY